MGEPVSRTSGTRALRPRARILRTLGDELVSMLQRSRTADRNLRALLQDIRQNGQPEWFALLPGTLTPSTCSGRRLPDLVVDFQRLVTLPREHMDSLERLASLDSPFAEALLARFARYFGRLGTPDLDLEMVIARLRSVAGRGVR